MGARGRNDLAAELSPLVWAVVAWVRRTRSVAGAEVDDLFDAGLHEAVSCFPAIDWARGAGASTFLWSRIEGAMLDRLRELDQVGREARRRAARAQWAREVLRSTLWREPAPEEVAAAIAVSVDDLSLAQVVASGLVRARIRETEDPLGRAEQREEAYRYLAKLPTYLRRVARLRWIRGLTVREMAKEMGISKTEADRMSRKALAVLRRVALAGSFPWSPAARAEAAAAAGEVARA